MKISLLSLAVLSSVSLSVSAQTPAPKATPTPNICDQTFSGITETVEHDLVALSATTVAAQPYADVMSNHDEQVKVLKIAAAEQNKGGPYTMTLAETISCDGGPTVRVPTGSIFVEGVSLSGMNKISREALKSGDVITKRYEDRAGKGATMGWNHKNAQKVQRDDLGNVIPPGQAKKQ